MAALFANQIQPTDSDHNEFWSASLEDLKDSWRFHLASIMSNQTRGWKKIVVSPGDELFKLGLIHASHFCYIVSGCPLSSELDPAARIVLVGCNHKMSRKVDFAMLMVIPNRTIQRLGEMVQNRLLSRTIQRKSIQ